MLRIDEYASVFFLLFQTNKFVSPIRVTVGQKSLAPTGKSWHNILDGRISRNMSTGCGCFTGNGPSEQRLASTAVLSSSVTPHRPDVGEMAEFFSPPRNPVLGVTRPLTYVSPGWHDSKSTGKGRRLSICTSFACILSWRFVNTCEQTFLECTGNIPGRAIKSEAARKVIFEIHWLGIGRLGFIEFWGRCCVILQFLMQRSHCKLFCNFPLTAAHQIITRLHFDHNKVLMNKPTFSRTPHTH